MPKDNSPSNPSPSPPPYRTVERMRYFIRPLNSTAKTWWLISWPKWSSPPRTPSCLSNDLQFNCMDISGNHRYTYVHIYYIYMLASAHVHPSSSRVLWAGDVTWLPIDSLSVDVVGTLRFSLFALLCNNGSALSCIAKIPITRNRILTHVYKYLNAFIIHIYTAAALGVFSPAYIYMYGISFAHALTLTLRLLLWCYVREKRRIFAWCVECVHRLQGVCMFVVLIPNLRKNGTHKIFECVSAPRLYI